MADEWAAFRTEPAPAPASGGDHDRWSQFRHPVTSQGEGATRRVTMPMEKRPDAGYVDAVTRGASAGATAGFDDELMALSKAGGAGEKFDTPMGEESLNGIQHLLKGFAQYLANDPEAHEKYNDEVTRLREAKKAAQENHPVVYGVSEVGGAAATLPIMGGAPGGATMGARALAAAKQGAGYGGVAGAGEGEGAADTAVKAAGGALIGGAVGGVAQPALEGAGHLIKKGADKVASIYRSIRDPETEAARQYARAYSADRVQDPRFNSRMHPQEFLDNPDARLVDLGGPQMRRVADQAGLVSPGGEERLKQGLRDRFRGQTNRFVDWFHSHFNYPDAYAQQQAIKDIAKNVNTPRYQAAMAEGDRPIMNDVLRRLISSDDVVSAMNVAAKKVRSRQVLDGYGGLQPKIEVTPDGMIIRHGSGKSIPEYPNLEFWDQTRRVLSDAAQEAGNKGHKNDADVLGRLAKMMNETLDTEVKGYKQARLGAARFFDAEDALEAGMKYVADNKMSLTEAKAMLTEMTPAERKLFQDGFVSQYLEAVIKSTNYNNDVLLKIANNQRAREKLELIMGREKMLGLEAKIRVEGMFNRVREAIQGNSMTAKRLYDLGMISGGGLTAHGSYDLDPKEAAYGTIIGVLSGYGKHLDARVATKLVDMMLSRDPQIVEKGFKLVSSNSQWLDALRGADTEIGRLFAVETPRSAVPQLPGTVRAEDEKPAVPRPPAK